MSDMLAPLLCLDSSADRGESVSRRLTAEFTREWRRRGAAVRYRDVSADPVPLIGEAYARLGRRVERRGALSLSDIGRLVAGEAERREWELTRPLVAELRAAGSVLLGVPMYNFGVPAALKAWIDRVSFPGVFIDPETGRKLLGDKDFVVICARGGAYGPGTPREGFDHQEPYLRAYLTNLGVDPRRLEVVSAELTRVGDVPALDGLADLAAASLAAARDRVRELAGSEPAGAPEAAGID
ncbi:FMN-dependent NADH-azoreductase [Amycolatopsis jiangsuensis]|uniref:FMN dependent NADH:quinone oxidoreductase n=1 Tax=Amycolatopsis jiangsuensis TaxID=1181879 RepID=A0A840IN26_9PSEU|nr:NAD(P)H-dependent oxidoreductase [Amycolatopsis jiangsuensis]MBB4683293.1 FMN-dependent NADH-azoreductase [Amycolatopsis jiangsuensis]